MRTIRLPLLLTILLLPATGPLWGQYRGPYTGPTVSKNRIGFQVGFFTPQGDSAYWSDKELEFTGRSDDFEDLSFGIDYQRLLSERIGLLVSSNFYQGDAGQSYIDFIDEFGSPITHRTTLETATVEIGLVLRLTSRDAPVIPYIGFSGGLYAWQLEEAGDFIDFSDRNLVIFTDTFRAEGETFGYSGQIGLEIPLSDNWSVSAEARWREAEDELGGDFQGFGTLDLSGREFRAGMSLGL